MKKGHCLRFNSKFATLRTGSVWEHRTGPGQKGQPLEDNQANPSFNTVDPTFSWGHPPPFELKTQQNPLLNKKKLKKILLALM